MNIIRQKVCGGVERVRRSGARTETIYPGKTARVATEHVRLLTADGQPLVVTRKRIARRRRFAPPVLLVHGFAQNRHAWHLDAISFAVGLAAAGFDVYNAELRGHGLSGEAGSDHPRGFHEYVDLDIPAIVGAVRERSGGAKPILIGHSLGGVIACSVSADVERNLAGIVPIAAPVALGRGNLTVRVLSTFLLRAHDRMFGTARPKPSDLAFHMKALTPVFRSRYVERTLAPFPLALWAPKSLSDPARAELIDKGFDRTGFEVLKHVILWAGSGRLADADRNGTYENRLAARRAPMLVVGGDIDRLAPPASVRPAFALSGPVDRTVRLFGRKTDGVAFGHYDLILGKHAPTIVWPEIIAWLKAHADAGR